MNEIRESSHLEVKKRSKKIKKTYNLLDFVVVKQKNKRTQQIRKVKISKQIQKRGKVRKKKFTTFKKKVLRYRRAKQQINNESEENETDVITEKLAKIQIDLPPTQPVLLQSEFSEPVEPVVQTTNIPLHSRKFREYCNHFITQEIEQLTCLILKDLLKFQENKFLKNPGTKIIKNFLNNPEMSALINFIF